MFSHKYSFMSLESHSHDDYRFFVTSSKRENRTEKVSIQLYSDHESQMRGFRNGVLISIMYQLLVCMKLSSKLKS